MANGKLRDRLTQFKHRFGKSAAEARRESKMTQDVEMMRQMEFFLFSSLMYRVVCGSVVFPVPVYTSYNI